MDPRIHAKDPYVDSHVCGALSRAQAAERLEGKKIGSWLLSISERDGGSLFVSVLKNNEKVEHIQLPLDITWKDLTKKYNYAEEDNLFPYHTVHGSFRQATIYHHEAVAGKTPIRKTESKVEKSEEI